MRCKLTETREGFANCLVCKSSCHASCLNPPRRDVPLGVWACSQCHQVAIVHTIPLRKLAQTRATSQCVECVKRSSNPPTSNAEKVVCSQCKFDFHFNCVRRYYRVSKAAAERPNWMCRSCIIAHGAPIFTPSPASTPSPATLKRPRDSTSGSLSKNPTQPGTRADNDPEDDEPLLKKMKIAPSPISGIKRASTNRKPTTTSHMTPSRRLSSSARGSIEIITPVPSSNNLPKSTPSKSANYLPSEPSPARSGRTAPPSNSGEAKRRLESDQSHERKKPGSTSPYKPVFVSTYFGIRGAIGSRRSKRARPSGSEKEHTSKASSSAEDANVAHTASLEPAYDSAQKVSGPTETVQPSSVPMDVDETLAAQNNDVESVNVEDDATVSNALSELANEQDVPVDEIQPIPASDGPVSDRMEEDAVVDGQVPTTPPVIQKTIDKVVVVEANPDQDILSKEVERPDESGAKKDDDEVTEDAEIMPMEFSFNALDSTEFTSDARPPSASGMKGEAADKSTTVTDENSRPADVSSLVEAFLENEVAEEVVIPERTTNSVDDGNESLVSLESGTVATKVVQDVLEGVFECAQDRDVSKRAESVSALIVTPVLPTDKPHEDDIAQIPGPTLQNSLSSPIETGSNAKLVHQKSVFTLADDRGVAQSFAQQAVSTPIKDSTILEQTDPVQEDDDEVFTFDAVDMGGPPMVPQQSTQKELFPMGAANASVISALEAERVAMEMERLSSGQDATFEGGKQHARDAIASGKSVEDVTVGPEEVLKPSNDSGNVDIVTEDVIENTGGENAIAERIIDAGRLPMAGLLDSEANPVPPPALISSSLAVNGNREKLTAGVAFTDRNEAKNAQGVDHMVVESGVMLLQGQDGSRNETGNNYVVSGIKSGQVPVSTVEEKVAGTGLLWSTLDQSRGTGTAPHSSRPSEGGPDIPSKPSAVEELVGNPTIQEEDDMEDVSFEFFGFSSDVKGTPHPQVAQAGGSATPGVDAMDVENSR